MGPRWRTCALGLALVGLTLSACLVPQDDHVLQDLPNTNHPPRIAEDSVSPGRIVNTGNQTTCPPLTFSAAVEDDDVGDSLNAYWYISDLTNLATLPSAESSIANPTGEVRRKDPAQLTINFAAPNPLQTPGVHVVELVLADGTVINRVPQPRDLLPDGGVGTPAFAVSYAWVVNVSSGTLCP
jgi:hypothetical protein